jgi:hypothetical protein
VSRSSELLKLAKTAAAGAADAMRMEVITRVLRKLNVEGRS